MLQKLKIGGDAEEVSECESPRTPNTSLRSSTSFQRLECSKNTRPRGSLLQQRAGILYPSVGDFLQNVSSVTALLN